MSDNQLQKQLQLLAENVNSDIYNQRKYLLGRVLTIVDAVASDPDQRKAIKDLINDLFYQGSYWNSIREQFQLLGKANGFEIETGQYEVPSAEPANQYAKVA